MCSTKSLFWQVSGVVDGVYALGNGDERLNLLLKLEVEAKKKAIQAGADLEYCQVLTCVPASYLPTI
jgi:hypothetical protein